eukprot:5514743-Pyramimonas_sp.AAC.1
MASEAAPKYQTVEYYNINEKKRQDYDISTPPRTPRTPRGTASAASSSAGARAPAASAAARSSAGQPPR